MGKTMEKNFKRLFCALLALGLSAPAFAESAVVVPSQHGGFKVGVDALYLRATSSDLDYATLFSNTIGASPLLATNASVDPSYTWGFYVQVGYLVPCTGNDITLGYTYLRPNDTDSVTSGATTSGMAAVMFLPAGELGFQFISPNFAAASARSELDLNAVDLEIGQRFTTGAYDMRMFAGLRYASIDHTFSSLAAGNFFGTGPADASTLAQEFASNYRGIGPRMGVDGRYCLQSGFGIDANVSTSLLVGKIDPKYDAVAVNEATVPGSITTFQENNGSRSRVVPVLEAKLGVDYTHIMDRCAKSSVVFEAGYQVTNYFNAIEHAGVVSQGDGPITATSTTDVAFDGPYLGVKYYA
jgi:hypothetical protein